MTIEGLYIIIAAMLIAASSALVGSFLILRKMSMMGDAISHAVLPGIVFAFLLSGSRAGLPMLMGAAATGVLASLLIELLYRKAQLPQDASIGITFTWLFALGVILISSYTGQVDLDQECVLYGEIALVPLDWLYTGAGGALAPRAIVYGVVLLLVVGLYLLLGYRGLVITSFQNDFAAALGISTAFWHFSFMSLVSVTTVLSFETVGAILILAFLVVPPATAYLMTHRLPVMLVWAVFWGLLAAVEGYFLARWIDGSIAGAMASVAGLNFMGVALVKQALKRKKRATALHTAAVK
ncbi:MAG: metal ABC transporter permease [Schleiferiaceae bacterium]|jgi:manganese/zinc/iron transport system permease protein|nr:metal ABC transporter permease [Schleiferiaceae bacterium]